MRGGSVLGELNPFLVGVVSFTIVLGVVLFLVLWWSDGPIFGTDSSVVDGD